MKNWKVHKFGGSCFTDAVGYKNVRSLISLKKDMVIVSAVYGITDMLLKLLNLAARKESFSQAIETIVNTHTSLIEEVVSKKHRAALTTAITKDIQDIESILHSVSILGSYSDDVYDLVLGYGEQWSGRLLAAYLGSFCKAVYVDAREVLFVEKDNYTVHILWRKSTIWPFVNRTIDLYWVQSMTTLFTSHTTPLMVVVWNAPGYLHWPRGLIICHWAR
jgi:aspartokinase/homoserine dehydrogenase 1